MIYVMLLLLAFLWPLIPNPTSDAAEMAPPIQIIREEGQLKSITYLETEIPVVEESIFPAKFEISATLGRLHGILFYSIDKNDHQLVLEGATIGFKNILIVRVGQMYYNLILADLCGCSRNCVYETLNLTLYASASTIKLQCNGRPPQVHKFPDKYQIDEDFPRINFSSNTAKNAAHLWMVNIQPLEGLPAEFRQLDGCFHKVKYRDRDLTLSARGPHVRRGCRDLCTTRSGICNMGHCVGTLNDEPVCDCTAALHIGKTCADKINTEPTKTAVFKPRFSSLKVSWSNSSSHRILLLQLRDFNITLSSVEDELRLQQKYHTQLGLTSHKRVLLHKYDSHRAHTAIIRFLGPNISILMPLDNNVTLPILLAYNPESQAAILTLYCKPGGAADAAFKYEDLVYEWTNIQWKSIPQPLLMTKTRRNEPKVSELNLSELKVSELKTRFIFIGLFIVLVMGLVMGLIIALFQPTRLEKLRLRLNLTFRQIAGIYGPVLESDPNQGGDDKVGDDIRTLRRHYINLKSILKSNESRTNPNFAEIVQNLRINTIKELVDTIKENDLYKSNSVFVSDHCTHILELLRSLEERECDQEVIYNIDQTTNRLQKLIQAIVNAALTNGTDGLRNGRVGNFLVDLKSLKTEYEKLCEVRATLTEDGHFNRFSETKIREFFQTICKGLDPIVSNIKINPDYRENKTYIDKHSDAILETLQLEAGPILNKQVLESSIMQLPGEVQMLMLAIVNVEYKNSNGP